MTPISLERLETSIIKPGLEKHLRPLLMYKGGVTLGRIHRLLNLTIAGMEQDCTLADITQRLQANPEFSHLCGPEKLVQGSSLYSFFSRLEDNPDVANNVPHLLDYVRSLGGHRFHLQRLPLGCRDRRSLAAKPWREYIGPVERPRHLKPRAEPRPQLVYPFLIHDGGKPEHDLLKRVNAAVPKWLPPDRRADICQDLIVGILSGEISIDALALPTKEMTKQVLKQFPTKYGDLSLDATIGDTDLRIIDTLSEEDSIWARI